jgi:hypothetical protein
MLYFYEEAALTLRRDGGVRQPAEGAQPVAHQFPLPYRRNTRAHRSVQHKVVYVHIDILTCTRLPTWAF